MYHHHSIMRPFCCLQVLESWRSGCCHLRKPRRSATSFGTTASQFASKVHERVTCCLHAFSGMWLQVHGISGPTINGLCSLTRLQHLEVSADNQEEPQEEEQAAGASGPQRTSSGNRSSAQQGCVTRAGHYHYVLVRASVSRQWPHNMTAGAQGCVRKACEDRQQEVSYSQRAF
jgi:hypothetical protein